MVPHALCSVPQPVRRIATRAEGNLHPIELQRQGSERDKYLAWSAPDLVPRILIGRRRLLRVVVFRNLQGSPLYTMSSVVSMKRRFLWIFPMKTEPSNSLGSLG